MTYSYDEVKAFCAAVGLCFFIGVFVLAVIYTFLPQNEKNYDHASRIPLDKDPDEDTRRGYYGR
jgi:cbb3-type cytochrome oxidase subunit 3